MIIDDIVAATKERLAENKSRKSILKLKEQAFGMEITKEFPFEEALRKQGTTFILEIKKVSPNKGRLVHNFDYKEIGREYERIGAGAIAVVTEPNFYQGDDDFLTEIKKVIKIPVLRKDFIIDEYMIYESKIIGADAVVLISGILDEISLNRYINLAHNLGMSCVVEVHSELQLKKAVRTGARIIAINNQNLQDLTVDLDTISELSKLVPKNLLVLGESGIHSRKDVEKMERYGVDGLVIGEAMMRSIDRKTSLEILKGLKDSK